MENKDFQEKVTEPMPAGKVTVVDPMKKMKPVIIVASVIAGVALVGATTWVAVDNLNRGSSSSGPSAESSSSSSSNDAKTTSDGDQKITKGGSYTFSGVVSGRIVIDTGEEVTITLKSATLDCASEQAAIKSKGTGKVTLVLEGENKITSKGDGVNVEGDLEVKGDGSLTISSADDGIHADKKLTVTSGTYSITAAEGFEATYVLINGGTITISASDDGINAAQKVNDYTPTVEINGGTITITMGQGDTDGIDSNGNIYINGGTVSITGQSTVDYDGEAKLNGGKLIINGTETTTIPNQMMGPGGGGQAPGQRQMMR